MKKGFLVAFVVFFAGLGFLMWPDGKTSSVCAGDSVDIPGGDLSGPGKMLTKQERDDICQAFKAELQNDPEQAESSQPIGCKKGLLVPENEASKMLNNDVLGRFFVPGYAVTVDASGDCQIYTDECKSTKMIKEYACSSTSYAVDHGTCPCGCQNGRCVCGNAEKISPYPSKYPSKQTAPASERPSQAVPRRP